MFKGIIAAFFGKPTVASVMAPLTKITEDLEDVHAVAQSVRMEAKRVAREAAEEETKAEQAIAKLNKLFA